MNDLIYEDSNEELLYCVNQFKEGKSANQISIENKNLSKAQVVKYLKIADEKGIIEYNDITIELDRKNKSKLGIIQHHYKDIICLNNLKIYHTYTDAGNDTKCSRIGISKCCNKENHFTISKMVQNIIGCLWMIIIIILKNIYNRFYCSNKNINILIRRNRYV